MQHLLRPWASQPSGIEAWQQKLQDVLQPTSRARKDPRKEMAPRTAQSSVLPVHETHRTIDASNDPSCPLEQDRSSPPSPAFGSLATRPLLGFTATTMIYAALPYKATDEAILRCSNGYRETTVMVDPQIGMPYGKLPRIIAAYLCTEAKRTREPLIRLGRSKSEFARRLGMTRSRSGGAQGNLSCLTEQAIRLFNMKITTTVEEGDKRTWSHLMITEHGQFFSSQASIDKRMPWEGEIMLHRAFFDECVSHTIPIDIRVIHALQSSMAIDIYVWLTYRFNALNRKTTIRWSQLQAQFCKNGIGCATTAKNFVAVFKKNLKEVLGMYPGARVDVTTLGITLLPSMTHISPKS